MPETRNLLNGTCVPLSCSLAPSWVVIPRASGRKALVQASQTVHRSGAGALAESLLSAIDVMTREVDRLTKRVLDEVRIEPTCRRLMTARGVGPFTALAFRATSIGRIASTVARRWHTPRLDAQTLPIR